MTIKGDFHYKAPYSFDKLKFVLILCYNHVYFNFCFVQEHQLFKNYCFSQGIHLNSILYLFIYIPGSKAQVSFERYSMFVRQSCLTLTILCLFGMAGVYLALQHAGSEWYPETTSLPRCHLVQTYATRTCLCESPVSTVTTVVP